MHILLVDDDEDFAAYLAKALSQCGHVLSIAENGRDGLHLAQEELFDAMLLDRRLPEIDGIAIVAALRASGVDVPIIFVSVLSSTEERVRGLNEGGDDYLPKPFALTELLARINSVMRRRRPHIAGHLLRVCDLELDVSKRLVRRGDTPIELPPQEQRLLEFLMRHTNQVVTRTMLLEHVWGYHFEPRTNVVDVHISRLRSRIDRNAERPLIKTVRGFGYMISEHD